MTPEEVNQLIRSRRSIFPPMYTDKPIPDEIIWELLENANHAPTHKLTQPWRFKVFLNDAKIKLGEFMAETYKATTPPERFKSMKYKKMVQKATKAHTMIAICMQRDPKESIPVVEETNAVSCAVQNIWLSAHAYGIGMYWSSPKYAYGEAMAEFLNLKEGVSCLGFIFMGYHQAPDLPAKRTSIKEKVEWIKE